nr:hypothetical protein [Tanacetum cinerariifolium]
CARNYQQSGAFKFCLCVLPNVIIKAFALLKLSVLELILITPPKMKDYIGRIQAITRISTARDAISNGTQRRTINIENLSGNIIGLTLWNEMGTNFNMANMSRWKNQLCCSLFILGVPIQWHHQVVNPIPALNVNNHSLVDPEHEKTRNRFPLAALLEVNPQNYQHVRFTSDATIYKINNQRKCYIQKCATCRKSVIPEYPIPKCNNHSPQITTLYRFLISKKIHEAEVQIVDLWVFELNYRCRDFTFFALITYYGAMECRGKVLSEFAEKPHWENDQGKLFTAPDSLKDLDSPSREQDVPDMTKGLKG